MVLNTGKFKVGESARVVKYEGQLPPGDTTAVPIGKTGIVANPKNAGGYVVVNGPDFGWYSLFAEDELERVPSWVRPPWGPKYKKGETVLRVAGVTRSRVGTFLGSRPMEGKILSVPPLEGHGYLVRFGNREFSMNESDLLPMPPVPQAVAPNTERVPVRSIRDLKPGDKVEAVNTFANEVTVDREAVPEPPKPVLPQAPGSIVAVGKGHDYVRVAPNAWVFASGNHPIQGRVGTYDDSDFANVRFTVVRDAGEANPNG